MTHQSPFSLEESTPPREDVPNAIALPHRDEIAKLVREHNKSLHAFLMTRVGNEQEAIDIAQEAYVRMLQLQQPGAISFLRTYLFKTAANIAIDRARERQRRQRLATIEHESEPVDELSPDRLVLSAEEIQILKRALFELSPKCRQAFVLCKLKDQTDQQVSEKLGIQPRMVRHYLTQACTYARLRIRGLSAKEAWEIAK